MSRDYPLIMGILTIGAFLTLLGNLLADVGYALADRGSARDERIPGIGRDFARRLLRNRLAAAGGAVILFFFLVSALPGLFSSHEPNRIDIVNILRPPSMSHPLGRTTSDGTSSPGWSTARASP